MNALATEARFGTIAAALCDVVPDGKDDRGHAAESW
jgi:hypothetical protein